VLRVFSRLNIGGPSFHVVLLTAGLGERGYATRLVVGRESEREGNLLDFAAAKGVRCEQIDGLGREIRPIADLRALLDLYRLIREYRPTIVHTHTAKAGMLGRVAARLARVPIVVHTYHGHVLRGYFGPLKTAVFRGIEKALNRVSDGVVAVSEAVRDDLVELGVVRPGQVRVIHLGLELERLAATLPRGVLRGESGVEDDAPLVAIVGRLVPIKDLPTFLRAAALVRRQRSDVRFAIVGDGEERAALEALAAELGLRDCVHFHGWKRDMAEVFGDADVVVNTSRNEGTPVAIIEALAAARPVVATRVGGTPDVLHEGRFGSLVPAADPGALAAAILGTLEALGEAEARAREGQRYVLGEHAISRLVADIDVLYRELLATRQAA
jgi:glycosyltransferase involved in cell wall biosynthesis